MTIQHSRRLTLLAASAVLALTAASPAFAAEAADAAAIVDPVIVTATRTEKQLDEIPVTASVITSDQIENRLATDIKDLLKYEPGVSVRTAPARFNAAGSGTGREGNRVLITVDGIRMPDAFGFGPQAVGRGDYAELDMIKTVEIVRGPASALYGSDGVAGSVSFFTKNPVDYLRGDKTWAAQARAGYASADESSYGNLLFAGVAGQWQGMISYTRREGSEQETQGSVGGTGAARTQANPQEIVSNAILAKLVFEPSDGHSLRLTYDHLDREMDARVLSAVTATTLRVLAHDESNRDRVSFDYHYTGGEGLIGEARANVYYQDATTTQFTFEDRVAPDRSRDNSFDNTVWGAGLQLDSTFETGGLSHRVSWGGDWSTTRQEGIRSGTVPTPPDAFPNRPFPNTDYTLVGLYAQDEISLLDGKVTVFPALRFDWYDLDPQDDALYTGPAPESSSDSHLSPKLGVVWNATGDLKVFANLAVGFKAPAPSQVNNAFSNPTQGYISIPNPDLQPETSKTIEAGLRWSSGRFSFSGAAFAGRYEDFISQEVVAGSFTPADPAVFQFINLGKVKIHGVEAKARLSLDGGWGLIAAASGARGDAESGGAKTPLGSIDPFKFVAGATWNDPAGRFGGELTWTHSAGKDEDRIGTTCAPRCFVPGAFDVIDLTAYWNVNDNVVLRGGVFNLTDQKYWWWNDVRGVSVPNNAPPPAPQTPNITEAYTQPGRNFGVSLTLKM